MADSRSREGSAEIEAIEAAKENVLPLRQGRSASKLTGLLSKDRKSVENELKLGHERFQAEIEQVEADMDNNDDPLDVYNRYIRWTLTSYPSGPSHASHLVPLLEQTTRRFVSHRQYKTDIRYLRLWILYSKYIDQPRDIYRFLEANDIGTTSASFYEEWATIEEASRQFKEAETIYMLGIHRRSEPLSRLKKRKDAFLARMVHNQTAIEDEASPASDAATIRPALGGRSGLGGHQSAGATAATSKPNGAAFAVFSDDQSSASGAQSREGGSWSDIGTRDSRRRENVKDATPWVGETLPMAPAGQAPSEKLQVFRDDDCSPPPSAPSSAGTDSAKSLRGPSEADNLRLNPFKNYTDPARASSPGAGELSFPSADQPSISSTLAKAKASSSEDASRKVKSGHSKTASSSSKAQSSSAPAAASSSGKKERVASPLAEVYPEDELGKSEYSFEEILAIRRGFRSRDGSAQASQVWSQANAPEWLVEASHSHEPFFAAQDGQAILYDENTGHGTFSYLRQRQAEEVEAQKREQQALRQQEEADRADAERIRTQQQARRKSRARERTPDLSVSAEGTAAPSPTINTKAAMAEVDDMFGSTMAFDPSSPQSSRSAASSADQQGSGSDTQDSGDEIEEEAGDDSRTDASSSADEAPVPSQASHPGDFVNDSFWGPVQSQPSQMTQPSQDTTRDPRSHLMDEDDEDTPSANPAPRGLSSSQTGPARRLFTVAQDEPQPENDENAVSRPRAATKRVPLGASQPLSSSQGSERPAEAVPDRLEVFQDEDEPQAQQTSAVDLGRRPLGEASRFAPMVNLMTPIVERTMEYGNQTQTGYLTGDLNGARPLTEDSEDDEDAAAEGSPFFNSSSADEDDQRRQRKASSISNLASVNEEEGQLSQENSGQLEAHLQEAVARQAAEASSSSGPIYPLTPSSIAAVSSSWASLSSFSDYHDFTSEEANRFDMLQKEARSKARKSASQSEDGLLIELGSQCFSVREKLGEGGFGAVFRVAATEETEGRPSVFALKSQKPAATWEYQQLHHLRQRLSGHERALSCIIQPYDLFHFSDESHLLLEVCDQGTLLDMVNVAPTSGFGPTGGAPGLDELLAMFFTVELLRVVESIHSTEMLHGDFKIDNCLVRLDEVPGGAKAWSTSYKSDGSEGWAHKGVKIIDYGRAIDLRSHAPQQQFLAHWNADAKDCVEVREGRPWTYEPDYYGVAGIAFTLLFGKHFEAEPHVSAASKSGQGCSLAGKPFRRYHQVELWARLFEALLDPKGVREDQSLPITGELACVRRDMEEWLEGHASKAGKNLKALLKKVEIAQLSRR